MILCSGAISTVRDFVESTIVLRKVQQELGLSITGGSDTYLVSKSSVVGLIKWLLIKFSHFLHWVTYLSETSSSFNICFIFAMFYSGCCLRFRSSPRWGSISRRPVEKRRRNLSRKLREHRTNCIHKQQIKIMNSHKDVMGIASL